MRDDQLRGRDAVHGDRTAGVVAVADPRRQLVEVEVVVVQDALARRQAVHPLAQLAVPVRLARNSTMSLDVEIRGGVGDAGDAVRGSAVG